MFHRLLNWAREHERPLATLLFVSGFVADVVTYTILDVPVVSLLFLGYLGLLAVLIFLTHAFHNDVGSSSWWRQGIAVLAPLFAQFNLGALFSGLLIFYTKSAVLSVSWPFLLLLLIVFFGNEVFRGYRAHLIFQSLLFFFGLYIYLIFAVPLYVGELGPDVFLMSTALAIAVFAFFLSVLALVSRESFRSTSHYIALGAATILGSIVALYFTSLIPPLPLVLKETGIYHHIARTPAGYAVQYEEEWRWWKPDHTIRHVPGTPLYAFSAIFAPDDLTTSVAHRWLRYDESRKEWVMETLVAFPVSGGREQGYRGYSIKDDPAPGTWQVRIETLEGQVIGRLRFTIENVSVPPPLQTDVR